MKLGEVGNSQVEKEEQEIVVGPSRNSGTRDSSQQILAGMLVATLNPDVLR